MKVKVNKKDILKSIGVEFRNEYDYLLYLLQLIDYLYFNNKNYTNKQYYRIEEIREILQNIEVV
jgi:hypothetical protein